MSKRQRTSGQSEIAQQVLAYLAEHPQAQDTLEGILHWWLLEQQIKHWATEVQEALVELVAQGLLVEHEGLDGQIRYRINQSKAAEIPSGVRTITGVATSITAFIGRALRGPVSKA